MSQEDFAVRYGISRRSQANYEAGSDPSLEYLRALESSGVDVFYLLTGAESGESLPAYETELLRAARGLAADRLQLLLQLAAALGTSQSAGATVHEEKSAYQHEGGGIDV